MHEINSKEWYSGVPLPEVLRYAGIREEAACGEELWQSAAEAVDAVGQAAAPKRIFRECRLQMPQEGVCEIDGMVWKSKSLAAHLRGCDRVLLFAATLGSGVDRLIARSSAVRMSRAVMMQAAAAALIEAYCDGVCAAQEEEYRRAGYYCKPRFSPGYGDFPLSCQIDLMTHLNAYKYTGISVSSGGQMVPMKSVSAVIGLTRDRQGGATGSCAGGKCADCPHVGCEFRRV